jgi:hypothetical protein
MLLHWDAPAPPLAREQAYDLDAAMAIAMQGSAPSRQPVDNANHNLRLHLNAHPSHGAQMQLTCYLRLRVAV